MWEKVNAVSSLSVAWAGLKVGLGGDGVEGGDRGLGSGGRGTAGRERQERVGFNMSMTSGGLNEAWKGLRGRLEATERDGGVVEGETGAVEWKARESRVVLHFQIVGLSARLEHSGRVS